jgi:peptidoglycan/xylan/chitin deacetylase (PgdA/CDA1 family)
MRKHGTFIISLDFELNWGVHDVFTLAQYEKNLLGTREAIDKMLELFNDLGIHATWATVGMLFFKDKKELMNNLPSNLPSYTNMEFSPYGKIGDIGENEQQDPFHYGQSLLKKIIRYEGQEISTHTFSHFYCLEDGQTAEQFEADLIASLKVSSAFGRPARSIVFPRNQLNKAYLPICKKHGIESFRGNEKSWIYKESKFHKEIPLKRVLRLVDCYVNITGHNTYRLKRAGKEPIVNLASSRFLRPYDPKLKSLENLRLRRIKKSLIHAAQNGEVYHLWWHPHNFGKDIAENMQFLTDILELVVSLNKQYGFESLTMGEATKIAFQLNEEKTYEKNKAPVTL